MAALVAAPSWLPAWAFVLLVWLLPAGWMLSTATGRQALVDERVRQIEAFGGTVDDTAYDAMQQSPPAAAYFTSGGRLLLAPPTTLLVAVGLVALSRLDGGAMSLAAGLAVSVHASVVLALQQLVATPLHYVRESLTNPTSLSVFLPLDEGTFAARLLGAVDPFGLWWTWLLALGVAASTARPARRYLWRLLAVYLVVAAIIALLMALSGGA